MNEVIQSLIDKLVKNDPSLTKITLEQINITDAEAKALGQALKKSTSPISSLSLGSNNLSEQGVIDIARGVKLHETSLQQLSVSTNPITDNGANALAKAIQKNSALNLVRFTWCNLTELGEKALIQALQKISLQQLKFVTNNIYPQGINAIATLLKTTKALNSLTLYDCVIDDSKTSQLAEGLKQNKTLNYLDLSFNNLSGVGAEALGKALEINSNLKKLILSNNENLGNGAIVKFAQSLQSNKGLQSLDFSFAQLNENDIQSLGAMLKVNSALTAIVLCCCALKGNISHLTEALKVNKTLTTIDVSYNELAEDEVVLIADLLKVNTSLTTLDLKGNTIASKGINAFITALETNKTITSIEIDSTNVTKEDLNKLEELLTRNRNNSTLFSEGLAKMNGLQFRLFAKPVNKPAIIPQETTPVPDANLICS